MNVLRVALLAAAAATDVVFVHVGKTCGGSAISFLRRSTNVTEVHLRPVDLVDVADASQIVVSVRDPVQRVLSAFDWHRPGNNRTFGRCVHRKRNDDGGVCADAELYKCAATADAFADLVLLRNGTDRCALLAKAFLSSDAGAKLLGAPLRFARARCSAARASTCSTRFDSATSRARCSSARAATASLSRARASG